MVKICSSMEETRNMYAILRKERGRFADLDVDGMILKRTLKKICYDVNWIRVV